MRPIFTIGYGNRSIDDFTELLKQNSVEYLVDVRSAPYSRYNPDFSKTALQNTMKNNQIGYLFLGQQLGGRPQDPTCYTADGRVDYDVCESKAFYQAGIERLRKASEGEHTVALMCSELKPHECHRSKLIGRTLDRLGIEVKHIDENGQIVAHNAVIDRFLKSVGADKPRQTSLFGDELSETTPLFTSRKPLRD